MDHILLGLYTLSIGLYLWHRASWSHIGPALTDAFVIGLGLFALGSILVWQFASLRHGVDVMRIGVIAGVSGTLAAALWNRVLRTRITQLDFFGTAGHFRAGTEDNFAIMAGLSVSIAVVLCFLAQVYFHEHVRTLLSAAIFQQSGTYTLARIIMSGGTEGYFAPGYVKQFRDIFIPILCAAAVLCHGTYHGKALFYTALLTSLVGVFIAGQRLVLIQFFLCLAAALAMDIGTPSSRKIMPRVVAISMFLTAFGILGIMTQMLGRLDMALLPIPSQQVAHTPQLVPKPPATSHPSVQDLERPPTAQDIALSKELSEQSVAAKFAISWLLALAHRSIMAVPQENALTYPLWASQAPVLGWGWLRDLASVLPGTQVLLANELSRDADPLGSILGASPLGLPTDLYYNWGIVGVVIFSALIPLLFLVSDVTLVASRSPLLHAGKLFLFFSVPTMYSPFLFLLYGGAAVLGLAAYVFIFRAIRFRKIERQGR